jgi:hypothetical protein
MMIKSRRMRERDVKHAWGKVHTKFWFDNCIGRDHLEGISIDRKIISDILKNRL